MRLDYFTGLGRIMGDMPFNIHENAIYGHLLGPHFSGNVRPLRHQIDRSDVASVGEVSQSRMRAVYEETQRIVQEESYARMYKRMRADKEAQLVDIWVRWKRAIRNSPKRSKTQRRVKRRPSGMGQKVIQLRLERAKGIPTALVLKDK